MSTHEQRAHWRSLEQAAMPGEWVTESPRGMDVRWFDVVLKTTEEEITSVVHPTVECVGEQYKNAIEIAHRQKIANAEFIAAARTAVPALIDDVARLEAELESETQDNAALRERINEDSLHFRKIEYAAAFGNIAKVLEIIESRKP